MIDITDSQAELYRMIDRARAVRLTVMDDVALVRGKDGEVSHCVRRLGKNTFICSCPGFAFSKLSANGHPLCKHVIALLMRDGIPLEERLKSLVPITAIEV
ncbi:SWIM zinc finger family protein [Thermogutta sp.]|uniref:SWIM zinc finger family protein n=1 Tax=Thermogutta sp. TaxID=1962930 RepID=UPI00321FBD36